MKRYNIVSVLVVFYIIAVVFTVIMFSLSTVMNNYKPDKNFEEFNSWYLDPELITPADTENPSEIEGYERGCNIYFYARLPEKIEKGSALSFKMKNSLTEVYFVEPDGSRELIRERDTVNTKLFGQSVGTLWINLPLDSGDGGRLVEIVFSPCYNDTSCYLGEFRIGKASDIVTSAVSERYISAATCVLMFFCGVLLLVVHFIIKRIVTDLNNEMLFLGMFSCVTAGWTLIETKFLNFLEFDTGALHNMSCMLLTLIIMPLFLFYQRDIGKKNGFIIPAVCIVSTLDFVVCTVLHFTGILDFHDSLTITHISIGFGCICLVYTTCVRLFKHKIRYKTDLVSAVGMLVIAAFAGIDIVRYRLAGTGDSALFTRIGLLIYIVSLGICSLSYTAEMVKKGTKAEIISRLAYEDVLTGMGNRTAYNEHVAALNSSSDYTFFMFDINNLKYVNDNMGHQMGDEMIMAAAEVIGEVFRPLGRCYRIGGDEFVCISEAARDTEEYKELFYSRLSEYSRTHEHEFPLMVAMGSGVCRKGDNVSDVINIADQNMYACKAELKKNSPIVNGR